MHIFHFINIDFGAQTSSMKFCVNKRRTKTEFAYIHHPYTKQTHLQAIRYHFLRCRQNANHSNQYGERETDRQIDTERKYEERNLVKVQMLALGPAELFQTNAKCSGNSRIDFCRNTIFKKKFQHCSGGKFTLHVITLCAPCQHSCQHRQSGKRAAHKDGRQRTSMRELPSRRAVKMDVLFRV